MESYACCYCVELITVAPLKAHVQDVTTMPSGGMGNGIS